MSESIRWLAIYGGSLTGKAPDDWIISHPYQESGSSTLSRRVMCQKCVDLCKELMPGISEEDMGRFLWEATAFPFADWDYQEKQIRSMVERSGGNVDKAIALACEDMDKEYEEYKRREESGEFDENVQS